MLGRIGKSARTRMSPGRVNYSRTHEQKFSGRADLLTSDAVRVYKALCDSPGTVLSKHGAEYSIHY